MTQLKVELENIRKHQSIKYEFKEGHVYLVLGKNKLGKTTFTHALKSLFTGDVPNTMITNGKEEGMISGVKIGRAHV